MGEGEGAGMQRGAGNQVRVLDAIEPVTGQGTAKEGHVYPELMGASGFRPEL